MGEKKGGPQGLSTVRLDPNKEPLHPKDELPPGDPGEEHAERLLAAGSGPGQVPQEDPQEEEVKDAAASLEEMRAKEDARFMEEYKDLRISELVTTGRVSHEVEIAEQKFVLRTLIDEENEAIEAELSGMLSGEGTMAQTHVAALIRRHILARSLVSMNGHPLGDTAAERYEKLKSWAMPLLLLLHEDYRELNKAIAILLTGSSGNSLERLLIGRELL